MAQLENIIATIAFFASTIILVIVILNFILKNRLINSGQTDPSALKLLGSSLDYQIATLKWGLVLLFGGIGLVIIYYIPEARDTESPLPYGIEMIFIALGFLLYYLLVKKNGVKG